MRGAHVDETAGHEIASNSSACIEIRNSSQDEVFSFDACKACAMESKIEMQSIDAKSESPTFACLASGGFYKICSLC
jgi:hypothetical protein